VALALALVVTSLSGSGVARARAATGFSWGAPQSVGSLFSYGVPATLRDISCPTAQFCAAVDWNNDVISSTDPGGGPGAWTASLIDSGPAADGGLKAVSCPTSQFCAAVIPRGGVIASSAPAGGQGTWSGPAQIDPNHDLTDVSCPSPSLCVAVDDAGHVFDSTDPSAGTAAWTGAAVGPQSSGLENPGTQFAAVACASASLCVAVADVVTGCQFYKGELQFCNSSPLVATSTNPAGGPSSWNVAALTADPGLVFAALTCPSDQLCLAIDAEGRLISSVDPSAGAGSWSAPAQVVTGNHVVTDIACHSVSLCAAVDEEGNVTTSTDPTGGAGAWVSAKVTDANLNAISCPADAACVAVGTPPLSGGLTSISFAQRTNAVTSSGPGGAQTWSREEIPSTSHQPTAESCPSPSLCVAVDTAGNVLASRHPERAGAAWSLAHIEGADGLQPIDAVSCPTRSLCAAVDGLGNVLTSTAPATGARAWRLDRVDPRSGGLVAVSCPSRRLCTAVDPRGVIVWSSHPAAGARAWRRARDRAFAGAAGVSCASRLLCVGVTRDGIALVSSRPADGPRAWRRVRIDDHRALSAVSCPGPSLCMAVEQTGHILTTTKPKARRPSWRRLPGLPLRDFFAGGFTASCRSTALCVVFGHNRDSLVAVFTRPAAGARSWRVVRVDLGRFRRGPLVLACPSLSSCVGLDSAADVFLGRRQT
jgi:hypothetical protein